MTPLHHFSRRHPKKSGQTLIFFAVMLLVLLLVVGMTIDAATTYLSKASLDKAVDAASLTIVRNLFQGQTQASAVGQAAFAANYRCGGQSTNAPVLNIAYASDSYNNTTVTLLATAVVNPYFIRLIPRFQTFQISSGATATRAKLIMSLVLDVSGSMQNNGGSTALPTAAKTFINYFDDSMDKVSMISFSSTSNLNVSVRQPFKSTITSAINALSFGGGTYSDGGLKLALQQNNSVATSPGDNVIRLVVFFTDGYANTFQYTWTNKSSQVQIYNVGGYDSGSSYAIFNPSNGNQITPSQQSNPLTGPVTSKGAPYDMPVTTFRSAAGTSKSINGNNFTDEGGLRALATADTIRDTNMMVFCIGLGNNLDQDFLRQIANDPAASTFDPNQPIGEAVFASDSSTLQTVFLQIAAKILLRLTK